MSDVKILCVKRAWPDEKTKKPGKQAKAVLQDLGFPSNHLSQSSIKRMGFDNEIGIYDPASGGYRTLYRPVDGGWVGHLVCDEYGWQRNASVNL